MQAEPVYRFQHGATSAKGRGGGEVLTLKAAPALAGSLSRPLIPPHSLASLVVTSTEVRNNATAPSRSVH